MTIKRTICLLILNYFLVQGSAQITSKKDLFLSNNLIEQNKMVLLLNQNSLDNNKMFFVDEVQKTFENAFFNQSEDKGLKCYIVGNSKNKFRSSDLGFKLVTTKDLNNIFNDDNQNLLINSNGEIVFENIAPANLRISVARQLKRR